MSSGLLICDVMKDWLQSVEFSIHVGVSHLSLSVCINHMGLPGGPKALWMEMVWQIASLWIKNRLQFYHGNCSFIEFAKVDVIGLL